MKSKITMCLLVLFAGAFIFSACKDTYDRKAKKTVVLPAGEVHQGWYFAAGDAVIIDGTVNGDVFAAGGIVEVGGIVNGDLIVAGGQVTVSGTISDDVRAAGGAVRISGKVGKSVTAAGGSLVLSRDGSVGRDLLAAGGNLEINGTVGEEARFASGDVDVSGTIKGNVQAAVDQLSIRRGAALGGNLEVFTRSKEAVSIDSGTVAGVISFSAPESEHHAHILGMSSGRFWFRMLFFLSLIVTVLALSFLLPSELKAFGDKVFRKAGWSAVAGIGVLLIAPIAALLLCCTLIGAPVGLLLFTALAWFIYLSQLSLGLIIAGWLLNLQNRKGWGLFGVVSLGLICIFVLGFVPYLHTLLVVAALVLGVGALSIMVSEAWKSRGSRSEGHQASTTAV